jgi:hypothetical protein
VKRACELSVFHIALICGASAGWGSVVRIPYVCPNAQCDDLLEHLRSVAACGLASRSILFAARVFIFVHCVAAPDQV